jgi:hypothetical protein
VNTAELSEAKNRAEVLLDQLGMFLHGLGKRTEDDAFFCQLVLEGGGDGNAVENRVHGHARERGALRQRDAEFLVSLEQLRIDLVQALRRIVFGLGCRVVGNRLIVDRRVVDVGPVGLLHAEPVAVGFEPPLEHELGLFFLVRDVPDDVLVESGRNGIRLHLGVKTVLVLPANEGFDGFVSGCHNCLFKREF